MSCRPQCFVPAFLGSIALLVLLFVPIYYFASVYNPAEHREYYDLPFENGYVTVSIEKEMLVVNIRRDTETKLTLSIDPQRIGNEITVKSYNRNQGYFLIQGTKGSIEFFHQKRSDDFFIYEVWHNDQLPAKACFELRPQQWNWFGGPAQSRQYWPIEKLQLKNYAYLSKRSDHCSVAERYWLNSAGAFIFVNEDLPLFVNQNVKGNQLCLHGKDEEPYTPELIFFKYTIGIAANPRVAHRNAVEYFLKKPTGYPDERMVKYPIWSTWPRYKENVNEAVVLQLADEIEWHGFNHSQIEIDDNWEECYGSLTFDVKKFPDIRNLTSVLRARGYRTTLWIHPFINKVCEKLYVEAAESGYFVADRYGEESMQWWQSGANGAAHIDFTNREASEWFKNRVKRIHRLSGIDSFKFDAGESSWIPKKSVLRAHKNLHPIAITSAYVRAVSSFGPMVEVRSAHRTQDLPIFTRMWDLDSNWSWDNGLPNFVTKLLQLNMVGYGFVLPDMIGGNGYNGERPDKELFIRWVQANVFMPSFQYSYVPWDYDAETVAICKKFTDLHAKYASNIILRFKLAVSLGEPVNPPIWWVDPDDRTAHQINDEFLLGDQILSAPVLEQGQTSRHIYLPRGIWTDGNTNTKCKGPRWLIDYPAPLNTLPYFLLSTDIS